MIPPLLACLAAAGLTGCGMGALSQGGVGYAPADGPGGETSAAAAASGETYKLTPEEAELDCKKLAGRVQIRILEFRSGLKPEEASTIARTIQSANAMFGGPTAGLNATAEHQRDAAQLQAFNKQLADKNCRSFDIAKALTSTDTVPSPTVPAKTATH